MLKVNEVSDFLDYFDKQVRGFCLIVFVEEHELESTLNTIKLMGYFATIRQTSLGIEILITDVNNNENA